jgi:hypothetical protein
MELYLKIQSEPRSKHPIYIIKTSQLMLYSEIITACSEVHTKHINALRGLNVEFMNVTPGGIYNNHWAQKSSISLLRYKCGFPQNKDIYCEKCSWCLWFTYTQRI